MFSSAAESCTCRLSLRSLHLRLQLSQMRRHLSGKLMKKHFTFFLAHGKITLLRKFDRKHSLGKILSSWLILLSKDTGTLRRLLNIENPAWSGRLALQNWLANFSPSLVLRMREDTSTTNKASSRSLESTTYISWVWDCRLKWLRNWRWLFFATSILANPTWLVLSAKRVASAHRNNVTVLICDLLCLKLLAPQTSGLPQLL
jgi:hypothetical protein